MNSHLMQVINEFDKQKILVIGDVVADIYLQGKISRISREAPVLVLEHTGEKIVPGGAANAVHNTATLGGQVYAVGIIGDDSAGIGLAGTLQEKGVITAGLVRDGERSTITKTRVVAGGLATVSQQVVRIDRESKTPVSSQTEQSLLKYIKGMIQQVSGVVMSDYGSGTISADIRAFIIEKCRQLNIPCVVDSRYDILKFTGVGYVKQNEAEAAAAANMDIISESNILDAGKLLLDKLQADGVLITRGGEGMSLFEANGAVHHIPVTNRSEVFDVSGAGDTAVAAMILALAAGAAPVLACQLANFAAGIAVKKLGTATVTAAELKQAIGDYYDHCEK
ncbi:ribokinase [Sporomusaceae bacterium FL31]|nr:ribokinase [Sporomusaceae bacterium FL31]GCE33926.1 ribokinase [Sporomusaceae bacterium]